MAPPWGNAAQGMNTVITHTAHIDSEGRLTLPRSLIDALGVTREGDVIVVLTAGGVLIRSLETAHGVTERIAALGLPVADWPEMETEIEAGRLR